MTAEFRSNQAEIKNQLNEMQSKLEVLMMRVNEVEERVSNIENKLYWKKEGKKGENKQTNKNKERYPLILYTVSPSTSPGAFQHCLVKNLLFPCPFSWSSG